MNMQASPIETEDRQLIESEVLPVISFADALQIKTTEDAATAGNELVAIKSRLKKIEAFFAPIVEAAHKTWKISVKRRDDVLNPLKSAEGTIKTKMITFENIERRRREEEARKAQAEADEKARKEQEKLREKAEKQAAAGKSEQAEATLAKAESVVPAPVFIAPQAAVIPQGASIKTIWKAECIDKLALVKFIANNPMYLHLLEVSQAGINSQAKAFKSESRIPGLKFFEEKSMSVRA